MSPITCFAECCVFVVLRFPWFVFGVLFAMPPAKTDQLDLWAESGLDGDDQVMVDFLLPTGVYIQMEVPRESTIQHIKLVCVFSTIYDSSF